MNNDKYAALRQRYPLFEYVDYHWSTDGAGLRLCFDFRMGDIEFHPTALVEARPFLDLNVDPATLDRLVFDIGMVELVSYWKCACPPQVKVLCGTLTPGQMAFWRKLYWNGLGEFYYTNGISESAEAFMQVEGVRSDGRTAGIEPKKTTGFLPPASDRYIVPIGGGKDSVVTLELLRRAGKRVRPLIMNPRGATTECARVAGFPIDEVLVIRRTIDPTLLELNAKGYLNGHTPFSAMLAFYTRLASALSGVPNVALSNENSANESTVRGSYVNHQYSKSLEFEDDFRAYTVGGWQSAVDGEASHKPLSTAHCQLPLFNYFSFLRPLSELQIAMLFSRFTAYHDVFRSCNVGSKQDIWCGHCAKCLFAYIILSPFIAPARLDAIFGKSLLADLSLEHELRQLLGMAETKPFECVGTVGEVHMALTMALRRWYGDCVPPLVQAVGFVGGQIEGMDHSLSVVPRLGNLSDEEYKLLTEACTVKNN